MTRLKHHIQIFFNYVKKLGEQLMRKYYYAKFTKIAEQKQTHFNRISGNYILCFSGSESKLDFDTCNCFKNNFI